MTFYYVKVSVFFSLNTEITDQLLLEVKNNYKFSVPFIGSSETKLKDGLMVLLGYPIIKKPRISWVQLKKGFLKLTENDYYEEILKLAVISQIYNPRLTNKAENLSFIFNNYPYPDTLAESLVRYHYLRNNYESLNTTINGINGFDGFFIKNDDKILVEVKFSNCGKPNPGMSNINGTNWRQLSTPYNKKILKDMRCHPNLKEAYNLISNHKESIKLWFIVLNAQELTLDLYDAGTFLKSELN